MTNLFILVSFLFPLAISFLRVINFRWSAGRGTPTGFKRLRGVKFFILTQLSFCILKRSVGLLYDKLWYIYIWFKKQSKNKNGFKSRRDRLMGSLCMIKYDILWYISTVKKCGLKRLVPHCETLGICSYFVRFSWLADRGSWNRGTVLEFFWKNLK